MEICWITNLTLPLSFDCFLSAQILQTLSLTLLIEQYLCAVLLTFPDSRLWFLGSNSYMAIVLTSARTGPSWKCLQHTTHSLHYCWGLGRHIQTNRWQFSYKKLSQFYSEIKFLQFYCTLYIVTTFHTQLSVICVVVQQLPY